MAEFTTIKSIEEQVERLIADNKRLRTDLSKSVKQCDKLNADNRELEEKVIAIDRKLAVLELKKSFAAGGEQQGLARARVNRLMREVDRCIALLNR